MVDSLYDFSQFLPDGEEAPRATSPEERPRTKAATDSARARSRAVSYDATTAAAQPSSVPNDATVRTLSSLSADSFHMDGSFFNFSAPDSNDGSAQRRRQRGNSSRAGPPSAAGSGIFSRGSENGFYRMRATPVSLSANGREGPNKSGASGAGGGGGAAVAGAPATSAGSPGVHAAPTPASVAPLELTSSSSSFYTADSESRNSKKTHSDNKDGSATRRFPARKQENAAQTAGDDELYTAGSALRLSNYGSSSSSSSSSLVSDDSDTDDGTSGGARGCSSMTASPPPPDGADASTRSPRAGANTPKANGKLGNTSTNGTRVSSYPAPANPVAASSADEDRKAGKPRRRRRRDVLIIDPNDDATGGTAATAAAHNGDYARFGGKRHKMRNTQQPQIQGNDPASKPVAKRDNNDPVSSASNERSSLAPPAPLPPRVPGGAGAGWSHEQQQEGGSPNTRYKGQSQTAADASQRSEEYSSDSDIDNWLQTVATVTAEKEQKSPSRGGKDDAPVILSAVVSSSSSSANTRQISVVKAPAPRPTQATHTSRARKMQDHPQQQQQQHDKPRNGSTPATQRRLSGDGSENRRTTVKH